MNGIDVQLISMDQDADAATDQLLFRDSVTWSKGRLRRARVMSMITGSMYYEIMRRFCRLYILSFYIDRPYRSRILIF